MELRFRGKKSAEGSTLISFWLCEGPKKRRVVADKSQSLRSTAFDWKLSYVLEDKNLHFLNESTGQVLPNDEELGKLISERDVVRLCSTKEMDALLEKFATRDQEVAAEMMNSKATTPISAALSRFKKMNVTNPTLKKLQKTLDEHTSPHSSTAHSKPEPPDQYLEMDPIFESGAIEEIIGDTNKQPNTCDTCDVSWPDDASSNMYRWPKLGIVTHQGCAQFTAQVLAQHPEITTREEFLNMSKTPASGLNRPGTFHVTVLRAMELPGTQLIGKQAPYAKLSLLPWKEPMQTKPVENGGRNPMWTIAHENVMQFSHMYNSTITPIPLLEVEVYNYNYLADDQVACTLVDMSPLLRYPNVVVKRWFTLSSRALLTQSTGQPKIMLAIEFVPTKGEISTINSHKFRVHQLKSIGLAMPTCAVCDRSIMNALKSVWGYRCELCEIDVHKSCMMKATLKCDCIAQELLGAGQEEKERKGINYLVLNNGVLRPLGELYVKFCGLHLCTKHCRDDFHAKNVFEGDTYCRLHFDGIVHETSPVLKSADPMYMEKLCFKVRHPNSTFRIDVIDFNSDQCIAQLDVTLFQLLQREADEFIRTNQLLKKLRDPLRCFSLNNEANQGAINNSWAILPFLDEKDYYKLLPPIGSKGRPGVCLGFALIDLNYVEYKKDLLHVGVNNDSNLLEREDKEFSVDSLRITIERFGRAVKFFQGIDAEYASVISWKNRKKSAVVFVSFVYLCLFADLEYALSYIFGGILVYMLYRLHLRLEGAFMVRWVAYKEYERELEEAQKLYRPLADLYVAVHEAHLSEEMDTLLMQSQSRSKDTSSSKLGFYVRIKYRPNDKVSETGDMVLIPSNYDETTIACTDVVGRSRKLSWRKRSLSSVGVLPLVTLRKTLPFRNFNVSWRHDPNLCICDQCKSYQQSLAEESPVLTTSSGCGVDHHAFYFPIPQASRKNFSGRDDLVPWSSFPGLVQFDLCISLNGEAKETPDLIAATATIPLRHYVKQGEDSSELFLPLSTLSAVSSTKDFKICNTQGPDCLENNYLLVRIKFQVPEGSEMSSNGTLLKNETPEAHEMSPVRPMSAQIKRPTSHVMRSFSDFVYDNMVEKEKSKILGANLFDAFWKVKDTFAQLQNEIGRACGAIACAENLFNWTHPWKTATAFVIVAVLALVFSVVRGRWAILLFGLTEFGAVYVDDAPTSKRVRKVLWNYLSSLPTDQDLIDLYEPERSVYMTKRKLQLEEDEEAAARLRYHALWIGNVSSKIEGDRYTKNYFLVYRPYRFMLWKAEDDAEEGSHPHLQLFVCAIVL
ncbi:Protein kinase C-like, phorbol ester/diacylglycerol binding [Plasmopara halstedii]|uniref:Protein kinase C-like, phorbol ester/diacylglycerol binding n=1 Tax=Plasmopara halstedii TaxID=4781 RepID=A0A0P1A6U8_PLAHL|nr:Protein kinase C-like, phorbol ester/diacylglycerol binding [Plasmopara halstedii]CEG35812.1 Protein kinase C-like, phorbol ester/diacylglycerol binding [Plasmopara halstedii]|eukprot:XP_024572181.1 Protein kinase C-like, phorbol ester/diacylglycerol binding [Plasmopara halstedii]